MAAEDLARVGLPLFPSPCYDSNRSNSLPSPFPGMDPYLENPELWPDVHNALIAALANELSPRLRPIYYVALEERTYPEEPEEIVLVGQSLKQSRTPTVVEMKLAIGAQVRETFLEVRTASEGEVVTVLELLSPANKRSGTGRRMYLDKRELVLTTRTSLVELDLLRGRSDYSVLVRRGQRRPKADLIPFGVRDPIPPFPLPLRRGEDEPTVDLGNILHALYDRGSYDLRIDYEREPVPPLTPADSEWARALIRERAASSDG